MGVVGGGAEFAVGAYCVDAAQLGLRPEGHCDADGGLVAGDDRGAPVRSGGVSLLVAW